MALVRFRNRGEVAPWSALREMEREINRLFGDFYSGNADVLRGTWFPQVDLAETEDHYELEADLPGMKKEDIDLVLLDNVVTIKGERKAETTTESGACHCQERRYGSFQRSFEIPGGFDAEKTVARFEDGVLKVTLPKREESKPKQIRVDVS